MSIDIISQMFNFVRIVNPITREVVFDSNETRIDMFNVIQCHDFLGKNKPCKNCISFKSYKENETFIKFEHVDDKIYQFISSPINYKGEALVIELVLDITEKNMFNILEQTTETKMETLIDQMNSLSAELIAIDEHNSSLIKEKLPNDINGLRQYNYDLGLFFVEIKVKEDSLIDGDPIKYSQMLSGVETKLNQVIRKEDDWVEKYTQETFVVSIKNIQLDTTGVISKRINGILEDTDSQFDVYVAGSYLKSGLYPEVYEIINKSTALLEYCKEEDKHVIYEKFTLDDIDNTIF